MGTALSASSAEILPGERGAIHITVDTSWLSGRINKVLEVITNDPVNDGVLLSFYGEVIEQDPLDTE